MNKLVLSTDPQSFIWASGIEDTFVPQTRLGHRALDEYELMGHYEHWREDLALLREVGVQAARWGVPWYRVEPQPGIFDWSWTDQVIPYLVEELGVTPIIDLMHYGCPFWLRREFANPDYPRAVAAYSAAFAQRYRHLVNWYTPLNEPLVNALMCGRRGVWPPYLRGDAGYVRVMLQIVKGVQATVAALKQIDPQSVMVQVEAVGLSRAIQQELEVLALEDQRRGYLFFDLIAGLVTPDHPLFGWLLRCGATPDELAEILRCRIPIEILGMNFYPQWSTKQIYIDDKGRLAYRAIEHEGDGFAALIEDYYQRYQTPIMITETSAYGADDVRARWLRASVAAVKHLRAAGVPVIGYTWFPLFTMVDWRYRLGRRPVERYYIDLGLYKLKPHSSDGRRWQETPLVEQMRAYIQAPAESVGPLPVLFWLTICTLFAPGGMCMALNKFLDQLAAFEATESPLISLYLNTQADERGRDNFDAFLRKEFKARAEEFPLRSPARASFERDVERINLFLRDELRPSANGAAIFACADADDFFAAVQTDAPLAEHQLWLTPQPFLFPLAHLNDQYPSYAALVADTNAARLYVFGLGEKLEERAVSNVNINRTMIGGWSQARYQRHVDNFYQQHAKEVVAELERLVREENLRWIVLAGDEVIIPLLHEQLPPQLHERVIDVLRLDITTPEHEVHTASRAAVAAQDAKEDAQQVEQLIGGQLAVTGAHNTLQALVRGQVAELLLSATPQDVRYDLAEADREFAPTAAAAPAETRAVLLADELIRKARQTAASCRFIEDAARLAEHGGVGAKLRFSL